VLLERVVAVDVVLGEGLPRDLLLLDRVQRRRVELDKLVVVDLAVAVGVGERKGGLEVLALGLLVGRGRRDPPELDEGREEL
jgi:hypothetical protein